MNFNDVSLFKKNDLWSIRKIWGDVLRGVEEVRSPSSLEFHLDNISRIGDYVLRCLGKELTYRREDPDIGVVFFPGNVGRTVYDLEPLRNRVVPTPDNLDFVLVSKNFFNIRVPKYISGIKGDYSGTWECVMDPRSRRKVYWAVKNINYENFGFVKGSIKGYFREKYVTWMAPHHHKLQEHIEPHIQFYVDSYRNQH